MRACYGLFSLILFCGAALAEPDWTAVARGDVDAAYHLLKDNHPAAVPAVGDQDFVGRLERAHKTALDESKHVESQEGLAAVLSGFANAMGDGHIRSRNLKPSDALQWAGIIIAKQNSDYVVVGGDGAPIDAKLISCDGLKADAMARTRLRFRADVTADFALVINARWLFVDDGNPFLTRPSSCVFEKDGVQTPLTLNWRATTRDAFGKAYTKMPFGQAGFGLRKLGQGYWIAMQSLSGEAQPVIDAVKAARDAVRAAAFVVIDLRGNGGGNSAYSDQLISEIWGEDYVAAATAGQEAGPRCDVVYRASPGNMAAFHETIETRFKPQGDKAGEASYTAAIAAMQRAFDAGQSLTGEPQCRGDGKTVKPDLRPALKPAPKGRVFVLTDWRCFSSCLIAVADLRQYGAVQIGVPTGFNTNYSETREITLPSGRVTFSTEQAIITGAPPKIGPFLPDHVFSGDITDTAALENWVVNGITK